MRVSNQQIQPDTSETLPEIDTQQTDHFLLHNNIDINLNIHDIINNIKFTDVASRKVAYFGSLPYFYPGMKHSACVYPELECFNIISEKLKLIDTDFNYDNYSCLVTYFPNGGFHIPTHQDNEVTIQPGSKIYTVSVGAARTIRFTNRDGPLAEQDYLLPSGSVYSMTQESQSHWQHAILPEPQTLDARISFTFRRLREPPRSPIRAPPISKPIVSAEPTAKKFVFCF